MSETYTLIANARDRQTPCCKQSIRVKIKEPGIQSRTCPLCKTTNYFRLTESDNVRWKGLLRMQWISEEEALHEMETATDGAEFAHDVEIARPA